MVALADFLPRHVPWAWLRLARGAQCLGTVPGLRFAKVMGSGRGAGFGLWPSATHQGLLALLDDERSAQAFLAGPQMAALRARSRRFWAGLMVVDSARGAWDGLSWIPTSAERLERPTPAVSANPRHPLAVITRASIRAGKAWPFWRQAPASQAALQCAPGCMLAMGLGEAPLLRQCTFSVWRNSAAMLGYAQSGAHGQAAQAAWREDFFTESMFVRLRLLQHEGDWLPPGPLT